jgi:alcohol dehydrogenase YqhD (iron-dependent ADH family)
VKQYYTLIQSFSPAHDKWLGVYLNDQGIEYDLGADFAGELTFLGYNGIGNPAELLKKYVVLIEEEELSAIMLSVGGVSVIQNRPYINAKNKIRGMFKWIVR